MQSCNKTLTIKKKKNQGYDEIASSETNSKAKPGSFAK